MVTCIFFFIDPFKDHEQHPCKINKDERHAYKASSAAVPHVANEFANHALIPPSI